MEETSKDQKTKVESTKVEKVPRRGTSSQTKQSPTPDIENVEKGSDDSTHFVFLPDDPVSEDSFGCHQNIANSIAGKIETDPKGKTIGLEGTWGSGKSSVIKMLEMRWKKKEEYKVFTYDAWTHQGDPLRRAFLEELIASLQDNSEKTTSWLDKLQCPKIEYDKCLTCPTSKKCRPDLIRESLRLRYEHNVIESTPSISEWGKWLAVSTLVMPIGVALFSASKNLGDWYFWLGFLLMSAAPMSIALLVINSICTKKQDTLLDLIGKSKETTKHTTHRNPEPTSIEFQEYFNEILELSLCNKSRKLVIVVDNLDRVEPDTALSVWGTMRNFLENTNGSSDDFKNNGSLK